METTITTTNPNDQLLRQINSPDFTLYGCIELICKHADNIGIHYYLCQKLLTFSHSDLQFYIPQLVQILLTIETESMALEDLLMKLKNENPHFALLTFWQLQALLTDLSTDPESYGFQVARRVLNNLQSALFNTNPYLDDNVPSTSTTTTNTTTTTQPHKLLTDTNPNKKMNENVAPAIVYSSMVMGSMAFPQLSELSKPLVESQGRRQKSYVFKLARNAMKDLTRNLTLKNTLLNSKKTKKSSRSNHPNDNDNDNANDDDFDDAVIDAIQNSSSDRFKYNIKNDQTTTNSAMNNSFDQRKSSSHDITTLNPSFDLVDSGMTKEDILFRKPRVQDPIQDKALDFSMIDDIGNQLFEEKISTSIRLPKRKANINSKPSSPLQKAFDDKNNTNDYNTNNNNNNEKSQSNLISEKSNSIDRERASSEGNLITDDDMTKENKRILSNFETFTNSLPDLHDVIPMRSSSTNLRKDLLIDNARFSYDEVIDTRNSLNDDSERDHPGLTRSNTQPPSHLDVIRQRKASSYLTKNVDISKLSTTKRIKLLKTNYFRCATQFAIALESISQRLAQVPTEARLSALRAELSLMNRDLPAEVDIPTLLPPNKKGKLHRLVLITASEAQVLNSAEKVPYLLLIEYLRDDFDFDPTSDDNEEILKNNTNNTAPLFDLNYLSKKANKKGDLISLIPGTKSTDILPTNSSIEVVNNTQITGSNSNSVNSSSSATSNHNTLAPNAFINGTKEMDLGDVSIVKMKNRNDAEAYRNSIMLHTAERVPIIPSDAANRNPELNFDKTMDKVISVDGDNKKPNDSHKHSETEDLADQMRISALMLNQLDQSPQELSDATNQIRAQIIDSMKEVQDKFGYRDLEAIHGKAGERKLENDMLTGGIDTSYLGEDWQTKKDRIRKQSKYGHLENWALCSVIAKSGDDLRQESFACQMIQAMAQIWAKEKSDIWVKKMRILITSATTGLVETITNAASVHSIKKALTKKMIDDRELDERGRIASLADHYIRAFGNPEGFKYKRAQNNFASSLAAYSLICYLLRVKDRHNGNIMIDNEGHVCHIDFGFMLSNSPGSVAFEASPFKLTYEYIDVLGGINGVAYKKYVQLMKDGFKALRKHADQLVSMCEIMQKDNMQPCFEAGDQTSVQLKDRFRLDIKDEAEVDKFVENDLIGKSMGSMYTRMYDQFQLLTQGIFS